MLTKLCAKAYCGYWNAKNRIRQMMESEDGMETLEAVIMIAVAVILVGFIVNFLTKDGFTTSTGDSCGLIQYLFDKIKVAIEDAFSAGTT